MNKKNKIIITLLLSFLLILTLTSISYSEYYKTRLISSGIFPQINNNGYIVWEKNDGSDNEIFLYDGIGIIRITNNSYYDWTPKINNRGQIVWTVNEGIYSDSEIFFYDGTNIIKLTDNAYDDYSPQINNNGYVVWFGPDEFGNHDLEIFLYDGTSVKNISNNDFADYGPEINDNGQVVWSGDDGNVYLYDGTSVNKLPNNAYAQNPQINNKGDVVWEGWDGTDWEIFLYDGTKTIQITDNLLDDQNPKINDSGYIVWERWDVVDYYYTDTEILLYNGTDIIQITDNSYNDFDPEVNNKGHVVWAWGPIQQEWPFLGTGISIYDGENITQLSDYSDMYSKPQINDNDYVVWKGVFPRRKGVGEGVFLAVPTDKPIIDLHILLPIGSEVLPSGGTYAICWEAPPEVVKFDLLYSIGNGTSWNFIKSVTGLHCTHWEKVPAVTGNKMKCRVKVIGYDSDDFKVGEGISDNPFTIEVLSITSPNGGETLKSGDTSSIQWTTHKTISPVVKTVLKYTTNGTTWKKIKTLTGNPGSYNWTVPNVSSTKCKVKVILKDAGGIEVGTDKSNKNFTIGP
jgi:hypothetical protein